MCNFDRRYHEERFCEKSFLQELPDLGLLCLKKRQKASLGGEGLKEAIVHLRNEFDFRKVHGIMNTSGLF